MDQVLQQELESVELLPGGEARARYARLVRREDGTEDFEWHRTAYAPGSEMPPEVAARVKAGSVVAAPKHEAELSLRRQKPR